MKLRNLARMFAEISDKGLWSQMADLFYSRTNNHIALVNKYAQLIYYRFGIICAELVTNTHQHDASKYEPPEFIPYVYLTWGKQNSMDFTELFRTMPECKVHGLETPQDIKDAIHKATLHHITTNKHHPEFHAPQVYLNADDRDAPPANIVVATAMDDISLAEMCADWAATGEELGTDLVVWAYNNIGTRWRFDSHQKHLIADFLTACVKNG